MKKLVLASLLLFSAPAFAETLYMYCTCSTASNTVVPFTVGGAPLTQGDLSDVNGCKIDQESGRVVEGCLASKEMARRDCQNTMNRITKQRGERYTMGAIYIDSSCAVAPR